MRRRNLLAWCALVLGDALGVNSNYYPHAPNSHWTYSSGELQVVGQPVKFRGVQVVPVNHQFGKILVRQDLLEYRSDGSVWLRGVNQGGKLQWYAAPLNVYPPGPLRVGQAWALGNGISRVTRAAALKNVTGTYNALVISLSAGKSDARSQLTYFVPGVGVVRYQTAEGGLHDLVNYR